jgi:4-hydroxybenzoate polyprenyltransferase
LKPKLLAWGRLSRLSLAPSAAADVAAGFSIGAYGGDWWVHLAPLVVSSLAIYHGGMVLNDYADRGEDQRWRPDRPLPSQAISARAALTAGIALELFGVALAALVSWRAGAWMAGVALLAVIYDFLGRGPWLGPALLAACRAGNLGVGLLFTGVLAAQPLGVVPPQAALLALLYGAYVFNASRVARLEDVVDEAEIGSLPRWHLLAAALMLLAPAFVEPRNALTFVPNLAALLLGAVGAFGLAWVALRTKSWKRADVGRATGMALRRLLVFTASCAIISDAPGHRGLILAAVILAGYPISSSLRRVFPPT